MNNFWCTSETIPDGLGYSHFSGLHLFWLAVLAAAVLVNWLLYRKLGQKGRGIWRKGVALLLIADELFKLIPMLIFGTFQLSYLPFHLCSINIFVIAFHACKPGKLTDNFLYTVGIPGAMAALLFPTWTGLPALNYMCIHSFTVHILLVLYPVVLTLCGEIKPSIRELPRSLLLLAGFALLALVLNLWWDTNFMFLMSASEGNPLYWFEVNCGNHLLGFPVIIAGVILVMYAPVELYRHLRKNR